MFGFYVFFLFCDRVHDFDQNDSSIITIMGGIIRWKIVSTWYLGWEVAGVVF